MSNQEQLFLFKLAKYLKYNVQELLDRISVDELAEWKAYDEIQI